MSGGADAISTAKDIFLEEISNENGAFKDVSVDANSISLVGEILSVCYSYHIMLVESDGTYILLYYFHSIFAPINFASTFQHLILQRN